MGDNRRKANINNRQVRGNETLRVLIDKSTYAALLAHASSTVDIEVGGILLGKAGKNRHGKFVHIKQILKAKFALEQTTAFTFTHESWNSIHAERETNYPELDIVGWYHTHPGYGIELSDQDRFIHRNFFSAPFHVAYVYDPLSGDEAFYIHPDGNLREVGHYWMGDRIRQPLHRPQAAEIAQAPTSTVNIQVMMPRWGWALISILTIAVLLLSTWNLFMAPERSNDSLALVSSQTTLPQAFSATATPTRTHTPELFTPTPPASPFLSPTPLPSSPTSLPATQTAFNTATTFSSPTPRVIWLVRPGDTFASLAWQFCVNRSALEQANGLTPGAQVRAGNLLTIPEPEKVPIVYIVQDGDTLSALAIRFCASVEEIMNANSMTNPRRLRVGQELIIPNAVLR